MVEKKITPKGTEYEDHTSKPVPPSTPLHPLPPDPKPHPQSPFGPQSIVQPTGHPNDLKNPSGKFEGCGPTQAELDACVAQLEATKSQFVPVGAPLHPGDPAPVGAAISPAAIAVIIDTLITLIKAWRNR